MHRMRFLKRAFVTSVQLRCLRIESLHHVYDDDDDDDDDVFINLPGLPVEV